MFSFFSKKEDETIKALKSEIDFLRNQNKDLLDRIMSFTSESFFNYKTTNQTNFSNVDLNKPLQKEVSAMFSDGRGIDLYEEVG